MWIAGFALFVMGVALMIIYPINKRKNTRCSAQTQGTLIDIYRRFNSDGYTGDGYLYTYFVDGVEYRLKSTVRSKEVSEIGDVCTIWYNPAKPKDAQPFHYSSNRVYTILLLVGIAMLLVGIVLIGVGAGQ